jgi:hypothetical protein
MFFIQNSLFYKKYKKYILKGWLFGLKLIFGDFSKKKENKTFSKFLLFLKLNILYLKVIQGLGKINQQFRIFCLFCYTTSFYGVKML